MYRKVGLVVLLVTLLAAAGWAQIDFDDFEIESVQADTSFDLFLNALDGAARVNEQGMGPGFSELESMYVFGGLANLNRSENDASFFGSSGSPLLLGFMNPGDFRWSLFTGTGFAPASEQRSTTSEQVGANTVGVVDGTTTTNYVWYNSLVTTEYTGRVISDQFTQYAQFNTILGPANVGFKVGVGADNTAYAPDSVFTETTTYQYNTAAVGEVPTPTTDYTRTFVNEDYAGKITSYGLEVPVYLETGDLSHAASLGVVFERTSGSYTQSLAYTVPQDSTTVASALGSLTGPLGPALPAPGANQFAEAPEWGTTASTFSLPISLDYMLYTPMFGEHEDNRLEVGLTSTTTINGASNERTEIWQLYDFVVGGDRTANTRSEYEQTSSGSAALDLDLQVMAGHSFYFEPSDGITFALKPGVGAGFGWAAGYDDGDLDVTNGIDDFQVADAVIESTTVTVRTDNDNDGEFSSAADTIATQETSYSDQVSAGGALEDRVNRSFINTSFTIPASIEVQPNNWGFSVTLGSAPVISITRIGYTGLIGDSVTNTVSVVDGTGTDVSGATTVNQLEPSEEYKYTEWSWFAAADHKIGLGLELPADVTIDVSLNLSSSTNILDFEDMVVQVIVPLP